MPLASYWSRAAGRQVPVKRIVLARARGDAKRLAVALERRREPAAVVRFAVALLAVGSPEPGPGGRPRGAAALMKPAAIRLKVTDLEREREFYERAIGLRPVGEPDRVVRLGADGAEIVELAAKPDAAPRPNGTTGLFHLAILVPSREELARALVRVLRAGWRLTGASDHLVSEALYLNDAEGNGIELYRDRPRAEWRYEDGSVQMSTLPLDVQGLLGELEGADDEPGMPAGTRLGHVHLNVADLDAAESFYAGTLGFDVTVRGYPGALFFATDGYHHHIGVNTWAGPGAPAPPAGSRGLQWFELAVGDAARVDDLAHRLEQAGTEIERLPEGVRTRDPSGNGLLITGRALST